MKKLLFFFIVILTACNLPDKREVTETVGIVDSVKIVRPGKIHTLQFDTYYDFYVNGLQYRTKRKVKVGDTMKNVYLYNR